MDTMDTMETLHFRVPEGPLGEVDTDTIRLKHVRGQGSRVPSMGDRLGWAPTGRCKHNTSAIF
jgi:hypothetical protein